MKIIFSPTPRFHFLRSSSRAILGSCFFLFLPVSLSLLSSKGPCRRDAAAAPQRRRRRRRRRRSQAGWRSRAVAIADPSLLLLNVGGSSPLSLPLFLPLGGRYQQRLESPFFLTEHASLALLSLVHRMKGTTVETASKGSSRRRRLHRRR